MNYVLRILERTLPSSISANPDRVRHYWVLENSRGDFICRSFNGRSRGANWGYKHKSIAVTAAKRFMKNCLGDHYVRLVEGYYPDNKGKLIGGKNMTKRRRAKSQKFDYSSLVHAKPSVKVKKPSGGRGVTER